MGTMLGSWSERAGWERAICRCSLGEQKGSSPPAWPYWGAGLPCPWPAHQGPCSQGEWHSLGRLGGL